ncbi:endo-1,4-beta-xylanase [Bogoriella caseilytica]|uniref:Beta-xylanase n=1 Tax=Bogoriella caseilytica TaxID=56055 RepID=A0A3N2B9H0_9MICO|nr:endo-1,4-beta-xylanase [Bogoriella caseilytica]ROR71744.1 endo-1,4-beta-xylanase [Bogoriella caseilytica]
MRPTWQRALPATIAGAALALPLSLTALPGAVADPDPEAPDPPGAVTLLDADFGEESLGDWVDSGGPERLSFDVVDGQAALAVAREADYHGIQSPPGLLADLAEPGDIVRFSATFQLSGDVAGAAEARWVADDEDSAFNYAWGPGVTAEPGEWVTLTADFEITAQTDLEAFRGYIGTGAAADVNAYTYHLGEASLMLIPGEDDGDDPAPPPADNPAALSHDFEDGELGAWRPRYAEDHEHSVTVSDDASYAGTYSALVSDRTHQGQGIGADATEALASGVQYDLSAWIRFADGEEPGDITLSAAVTTEGSTSYSSLGQFSGFSNTEWIYVEQRFTTPDNESLEIYFETAWDGGAPGNTSSFHIDNIEVAAVEATFDPGITPLQDTVDFPLGVAIDVRETTGTASQVVNHHFDRVTAENHMKPEAWYTGVGIDTFAMHAQARAILDYAVANDLGVYGHVLVWHSQTPDWFFQDDSGETLTREALDSRMEEHIRNVAEVIAEEYGPYGSPGNPMVAWDVVNEVIADGSDHADGMRRSQWYQIWGDETYVDRAFEYAERYFNDEYAEAGSDRPVALYINDYNTEISAKRARMIGLTDRLLRRGAPVDGFAHQFHLNLSMPISALQQALNDVEAAFPDMPQLVTELDITVGTSVTEGALIDQGYHYRDAFRLFREWSSNHQLDSVAIWGLNDGRSWRAAQAPLVFNDDFSPKYAYYGVIDAELPPQENSALIFYDGQAPTDPAVEGYWDRLPLHATSNEVAEFQAHWHEDGLTVYVDSEASSATLDIAGESFPLAPDGVTEVPLPGLSAGQNLPAVVTADGDSWTNGTFTFVEELSYHEAPEAEAEPVLDPADVDLFSEAAGLVTQTEIETGGRDGATAEVRLLWHEDELHILADVTDPEIDVSHSDPWVQDSVEFFLDLGNARNGTYRIASREGHHLLSEQYDFQFRISATNEVSVGTGDEEYQLEQISSETMPTEDGYRVRAVIDLRDMGGLGTLHGFDVQVNDSHEGARLVTSWADPTGNGYQNTQRWGVIRLVDAVQDEDGEDDDDDGPGVVWPPDREGLDEENRGGLAVLTDPVVAGEDFEVMAEDEDLGGEQLRFWLFSEPVDLGEVTLSAERIAVLTAPLDSVGSHQLAAYSLEGELIGWTDLTIVAPAGVDDGDDDEAPGDGAPGDGTPGDGAPGAGTGGGALPVTGAQTGPLLALAGLLALMGLVISSVARGSLHGRFGGGS